MGEVVVGTTYGKYKIQAYQCDEKVKQMILERISQMKR